MIENWSVGSEVSLRMSANGFMQITIGRAAPADYCHGDFILVSQEAWKKDCALTFRCSV